jgi:hypothetical protein
MKNYGLKSLLLSLALLLIVVNGVSFAQEPPAEPPPNDVSGKWTIYSNMEGKAATQYIEIKQNGNLLSGHFKGPHQSGGLAGTLNVHHIVFSTKTRDVLTFRGTIEGNMMKGNFGNHGIHGVWQAERTN